MPHVFAAVILGLAGVAQQPSVPVRDLSGLWQFFNGIPGQGIYATPSRTPPPLTAWGKARYDAAKPGYGPKATPGGNDPILHCDPTGIPRLLFFPQPFEIVQTADRMVMLFERDHLYRPIWLNRRTHPDDLIELWIGDSVGWWENDTTFVVDSTGFNDKTWLDFYGYPHSEQLHIVERYTRVDRDTMKLNFTVEDPKAFSGAWISDTKIYKLLPKDAQLTEIFCVPEEEDAFTKRIRIPAANKPGQ